MGPITLGIDLGQKHDPSALCVVQSEDRGAQLHYVIRHLERLALGTPYPAVVDRIERITRQIVTKTGTCPELFVDATGVGTPVVELLRDRLLWAPKIWAVTLTRGSRRIVKQTSGRSGEIRLGKARMVQRLLALFEARCVHLPRSGEAQALARELLSYEIRVDPNGGERYGAFQAGAHDDLVTALGLAV